MTAEGKTRIIIIARRASSPSVRAVRLSLARCLADYLLLTNNTTTTATHRPSHLPPSPRHIPPPLPSVILARQGAKSTNKPHRHPFFRPAAATACLPAATHSIATHLAAHATQFFCKSRNEAAHHRQKCPLSLPPRVWWASCLSPTLPFRLSRLRGSTRRLTACGPKSLDLLDKCTFDAMSQFAIKAIFGFGRLPPSEGWSLRPDHTTNKVSC